eukprot:14211084-Alexandrium_andersonii.AAC.1
MDYAYGQVRAAAAARFLQAMHDGQFVVCWWAFWWADALLARAALRPLPLDWGWHERAPPPTAATAHLFHL